MKFLHSVEMTYETEMVGFAYFLSKIKVLISERYEKSFLKNRKYLNKCAYKLTYHTSIVTRVSKQFIKKMTSIQDVICVSSKYLV